MNDLLKHIIDKKISCVFLSPHFDDAVLSCGMTLLKLQGKTSVTVVNVFTKAHTGPFTLSTKKMLRESDEQDALRLYTMRAKEDENVLTDLGVKIVDLGFEDGIFRRKRQTGLGKILPELDHVYPTYQWHLTKNFVNHDPVISQLQHVLEAYNKPNTIIFAPYGIGNHADHQIVRHLSKSLFAHVIFYSDFPYNRRLGTYGTAEKDMKEYHVVVDKEKKDALIKGYKTQIAGLFANSAIPNHEEVYFTKITV